VRCGKTVAGVRGNVGCAYGGRIEMSDVRIFLQLTGVLFWILAGVGIMLAFSVITVMAWGVVIGKKKGFSQGEEICTCHAPKIRSGVAPWDIVERDYCTLCHKLWKRLE